jgi:hypothetical protein
MDARREGRTEHIELNGASEAHFEDMYTLLQGVQQSMPFLPAVWK